MRPLNIPKKIRQFVDSSLTKSEMCNSAKLAYERISDGEPVVSIVMPAYNETLTIVPTLASLCNNKTSKIVEIIVCNNNSKDDTASLATACGVNCINEYTQGIVPARNAGLAIARGKYILNADADTIYPEDWIEEMINPLVNDQAVSITYGRFGTIPTASTGRWVYFLYEHLAESVRWFNKKTKDEAVNVYGFNSGFRREQGLSVDGFNHPVGTNEDGFLAVKLREKGYGKLHYVTAPNAMVWTTDRRIQLDGGFVKGTIMRIKRLFK